MQPYGNDRLRVMGEKIFLYSPISKGWTARTRRVGTHAEHPGTTVLWDGAHFEVLDAEGDGAGGVRYVLAPWRDDHTIRTFEAYDAESEQRRIDDHALAARQRRSSMAARLSGIVLGHLPSSVQNRLQNEVGIVPLRMTMLSCIPSLVLLGVCLMFFADTLLKGTPLRVPVWLFVLAALLTVESLIRFYVAMSQNRGIGSVAGCIIYTIFWLVAPNRARFASPFGERGDAAFFTLPQAEDLALRESLEMRAPLLTLLSEREQRSLAARYGFDYRQHAAAVAAVILAFAAAGTYTSASRLADGGGVGAGLSMLIAAAVGAEQVWRLVTFRQRPVGSVFAAVVRPFVRDLLDDR